MTGYISEIRASPRPGMFEACLISSIYQRSRDPEIRTGSSDREYIWGLRGRNRVSFYWNAAVAWVCSREPMPGVVRIAERLEVVAGRSGKELLIYRRRVSKPLWFFTTPVALQLKERVPLTDFEVVSQTAGFVHVNLGDTTVWFPRSDADLLRGWLSRS